MQQRKFLPLCAVLTLAASSCTATHAPLKSSAGRIGREGFPPQAALAGVHVEARYYLDQAHIFGGDLLQGFAVVPVALRLGVTDANALGASVPALPADMDIVLLLPDGTALAGVGADELDVRRRRLERMVQESLGGGFLPPWTEAREGFVYFALPESVRIDPLSLRVRRRGPGGLREMDLCDSVVSLSLPIDGQLRELNVGLQLDRDTPSRLQQSSKGAPEVGLQ